MPRKFTRDRKSLLPHHVYNQGFKVGGTESPSRKVFVDRDDRRFFLELLSRHLGSSPRSDGRNRPFKHLRAKIALLAFCLMTTHFHLIVWQRDRDGIAELMHHVSAAYTRYFNKKYGNSLPLFNGPAQAKPVADERYFRWLVGYVHDNHPNGVEYEFSSHRAWVDPEQCPGWLEPAPGIAIFGSIGNYRDYLRLREARSEMNQALGI